MLFVEKCFKTNNAHRISTNKSTIFYIPLPIFPIHEYLHWKFGGLHLPNNHKMMYTSGEGKVNILWHQK